MIPRWGVNLIQQAVHVHKNLIRFPYFEGKKEEEQNARELYEKKNYQ